MLKDWISFVREDISQEDINRLEKKYEGLLTKKLIELLIQKEKALQYLVTEREHQEKIIKQLDIYKTIVIGGGATLVIILPVILFKYGLI